MNIRKIAVAGALTLSLTVGSASAFAASVQDTVGLSGEEPINKLVALKVFPSGESFRPEAPLTRGELSYILNQVLPLSQPEKAPHIQDLVTKNGANSKTVKVVANGLLSLNNGKFNAWKGVTYAELSKALAYGLGFKASWSDRAVDAFYFLERKGVLSIDTDLDAVVSREDAAIILDKFLSAKGSYNLDNGVVSALISGGMIINNGSEYAEYKLAGNAALFINGEAMESISAFGAGTAVQIALNDKGEVAYVSGGVLGLQEGTLTYDGGKISVNGMLKNVDLNMVVNPLPNLPEEAFTFTNFGMYSTAGVTFGGGAYINESGDEVTLLSVYFAKAEGKAFTVSGSKLTLDFSGDGLDNQTFEVSEEVAIAREGEADKPLALSDLAALQKDNTLSGTVEFDDSGLVTSITFTAEPKSAESTESAE